MIGYWCAHYRGLHSFVVSFGCCGRMFREDRAENVGLGKKGKRGKGAFLVVPFSHDFPNRKSRKEKPEMLDALQVWWTIIPAGSCAESVAFPSIRSCRPSFFFYHTNNLVVQYLDLHKFVDAFTSKKKQLVSSFIFRIIVVSEKRGYLKFGKVLSKY